MQHSCIRVTCRKSYEDEDPEPYYCPECREQKQQMAAQIDAMVASRPRKEPKSMLAEYEAAKKINGFMPIKL